MDRMHIDVSISYLGFTIFLRLQLYDYMTYVLAPVNCDFSVIYFALVDLLRHALLFSGSQRVQAPMPHPTEMDHVHKMSLPVFGLASYKFKGSLWTPNGGHECQRSLLQGADDWLRLHQVSHPDFQFFSR